MRGLIQAAALASCIISTPQLLSAQSPQLTLRVIATIDYPGSRKWTRVQGINDLGDVTGYFKDASGAIRSFIRYADGTFSEPIVEPNDTGNITVATDINNLGEICGYYSNADPFYPYHGFLLSGTTFTEIGFDRSDTYVTGITDAGDFCATLNYSYNEGYVLLADGEFIFFNVGASSEAKAINVHAGIVGDYDDGSGVVHGYFKDTVLFGGRIMAPVDYPGSTETVLLALNDGGRVIVGNYVDSVGVTHGLILQRPDTWTSYDYPGAIETSLNGINNNKLVSGYYADSSGVHHGFIGKVQE